MPAPGCQTNVRSDRKSTRLNSSHSQISYAVFCLKKKKKIKRNRKRLNKSRSQILYTAFCLKKRTVRYETIAHDCLNTTHCYDVITHKYSAILLVYCVT